MSAAGAEQAVRAVPQEDLARADLYALISGLFYAPPSAELLRTVAAQPGPTATGDSAFARAWEGLRVAAGAADAAGVAAEYDTLFYGVGRPLVMLYGASYITGYLHGKSLADLRADLARLGFGRKESAAEPEDHVAGLADVMRLLIVGGSDVAVQADFFTRHLKPWYTRLAQALEQTQEADFYRHAGRFMQAFFDVETASFEFEIGN